MRHRTRQGDTRTTTRPSAPGTRHHLSGRTAARRLRAMFRGLIAGHPGRGRCVCSPRSGPPTPGRGASEPRGQDERRGQDLGADRHWPGPHGRCGRGRPRPERGPPRARGRGSGVAEAWPLCGDPATSAPGWARPGRGRSWPSAGPPSRRCRRPGRGLGGQGWRLARRAPPGAGRDWVAAAVRDRAASASACPTRPNPARFTAPARPGQRNPCLLARPWSRPGPGHPGPRGGTWALACSAYPFCSLLRSPGDPPQGDVGALAALSHTV